jgi:hypothetical protein
MKAEEIIGAAIPLAQSALRAIEAAQSGNLAEAAGHLRAARAAFDSGSAAWDAANSAASGG